MIEKLVPFIMLDGNAKEAIDFYESSLGAKVVFKQTFGEGPQPASEEEKDRIAHSVLKIGEAELMVSDTLIGQAPQAGNRLNICIISGDAEQSRRLYDALCQDGQADIPLGETFFSPAYGMVTDKFGVTFQVFTKRHR